jgi:coiled-coil domain-containing protein 61
MSNINIEYSINFKGTEYILYLSANENSLKINLETANESNYWNGEYDARYLEEITTKIGSYKSFHVILKMLMSALAKESETVMVELLSFRDLEAMRMKRSMNNSNTSLMSESVSNNLLDPVKMNKKYLIITYANEFEKVNFPLPLNYLIQPDMQTMLRTIERLRKCKNANPNNFINNKEIEDIKLENINLKNKIKLLESQRKFGAVDNDESLRNYNNIKEEYEAYKTQAENKIKLLSKTIEDIKANFSSTDHNKAENNEKYIKIITELESRLKKAEEILIKERREGQVYIEEKNKDIEAALKEVNFYKENEKKLNVKIKQLEKELEYQMKRSLYNTGVKMTTKNSFTNKSNKSNVSYNSSVRSEVSNNSRSGSLKKDLLANPYNKFKGLNNRNYSPFKFGNTTGTKSYTSNKSSKSGYSKNSYTSGGSISKTKSLYSNTSSKPSYLTKKTGAGVTATNFVPNKNKTLPFKANPVKSTISSKYNKNTTTSKEKAAIKKEPSYRGNNIIKTGSGGTNILTNTDDINARLGRIQHLLNTAKV